MKIFVLEDQIDHQVRLETVIKEISKELQLPIEVTSTGKTKELEEYIQTGAINQLYFLDIQIKGELKKGLEIAQEIRLKDPYSIIVFISSKSEFALTTYQYQVSALDFIAKDFNDEVFKRRVKEAILYTQETLVENKEMIDYFDYQYKTGSPVVVPYRDILYMETSGTHQRMRLVCKNLQKEFMGVISDLAAKEEATKKRFLYRVHKSFLVNIYNIQEIDRKKREAILFGGDRIPIARTFVNELEDLLLKIKEEESY